MWLCVCEYASVCVCVSRHVWGCAESGEADRGLCRRVIRAGYVVRAYLRLCASLSVYTRYVKLDRSSLHFFMDFLKKLWSPKTTESNRDQGERKRYIGMNGPEFKREVPATLPPGSPRLRPRLLSRTASPPKHRHLSGSAAGMTRDELRAHVDTLRTSRHTFLPHLSRTLRKLMEHAENKGAFNHPVDIPGYSETVTNPMDLQSVRSKLVSGEYSNIQEFSADVRLVFDNARLFNAPGHPIHKSAATLHSLFDHLLNNCYQKIEQEAANPILQVLPPRHQNTTKKTKTGARAARTGKTQSAGGAATSSTSTAGSEECSYVEFVPQKSRVCSLCDSGDMVLSIPVLRCGAPCNAKIQRGAVYYVAPRASAEGLAQHWCHRCYNGLSTEFFALYGERLLKSELIECLNNEVFLEKWIQCGGRKTSTGPAGHRRCGRVMHMACALYMPTTLVPLRPPYIGLGWTASVESEPRLDFDKHFKCPHCYLNDDDDQWDKYNHASTPHGSVTPTHHSKLKSLDSMGAMADGADRAAEPSTVPKINDWHAGYSPSHQYSAPCLPESSLSKRIERRLRRRIFSEAIKEQTIDRERAVDFLSSVTVRAFAGEFRSLSRWPRLSRWVEAQRRAHQSNPPSSFPYRPVAVFMFQRVSGTDVCLFAMYVHEYTLTGDSPNARKAYISYLDSTNYMQPSLFRTPTYHEIMLGYLEDAKQRGYESVYIWACPPPPRAGDSYILNCHPKWQRTPNTERLVKWYKTIEEKAMEEGLVVQSEDMLASHFFGHRSFRQTRGSITSSRRRTNGKATSADMGGDSGHVPNIAAWGKGGRASTVEEVPYFSGDFWNSEVETILGELEGFSELEDDPDEGMRVWWQELTRKELSLTSGKKKRKASDAGLDTKSLAPATVSAPVVKPSKFERELTAVVPASLCDPYASPAVNRTVQIKPVWMQTPANEILKRRENDRMRWLEHVRKSKLPPPKMPAAIPASSERDSWLMSRVAARISPNKEHHLVWHLRYKCFGCLNAISDDDVFYRYDTVPSLSKDSQYLCRSCHCKSGQNNLFAFRFNKPRKRNSLQFIVKEILPNSDIGKKSPSQNNNGPDIPIVSRQSIFDTRVGFLAYLQRMSFQFDQLRRAKHSSMMILYHMHCEMTRPEDDLPPLPPGLSSLSDQVY